MPSGRTVQQKRQASIREVGGVEEQLWTVGSLVLGGRSTLGQFGESVPCETAFTATSRSFLLSPLFYPHPHPTALIVLDVASSLLLSLFFS